MTLGFKAEGEAILLVGETHGWLGQSLYLREVCGREEGAPPPVDLAAERRHGDFVRGLDRDGLVTARPRRLRRRSPGRACRNGDGVGHRRGAGKRRSNVPAHGFWFGEDQARYVRHGGRRRRQADRGAGARGRCAVARLGATGGHVLAVANERPIAVAQLRERFEAWLPAYMAGAA